MDLTYRVTATKRFGKDIKRLIRQGVDISLLRTAVELLRTGEPLPQKYRDHQLKGDQKEFRECHITSSWILKYLREEDKLFLQLIRTGSHRDVLGVE